MMNLAKLIIEHHHLYKRDFLWRHTNNPYEIMIAEFMLRRTKAEQVAPVYAKFLANYPDLKSLKSADMKDISKITYNLGLHWRTADFINACMFIDKEYGGIFPDNRKDLVKIPGIGDYVAGTILTICFKKPEYVIDSNIARFINRFYGYKFSGEVRRKKLIIEKATELFNCKNPDKLLFSILDFTNFICKPHNPECNKCYLSKICYYDRGQK